MGKMKKGTGNFALLPSHIIINILRGLLKNKPLFFFWGNLLVFELK